MVLVIFDTNILLLPGTFRVDIFEEARRACDFVVEIAVLQKSLKELEYIIEEQGGKAGAAAKLALQILKKKNIKVIPTADRSPSVDTLLVQQSKAGAVIVTQDAGLKRRLKRPYLTLRNKKFFVLVR